MDGVEVADAVDKFAAEVDLEGELLFFSSSSSILHLNFLTVNGLSRFFNPGLPLNLEDSVSSLVATVRSDGLLLIGFLINLDPSSELPF